MSLHRIISDFEREKEHYLKNVLKLSSEEISKYYKNDEEIKAMMKKVDEEYEY